MKKDAKIGLGIILSAVLLSALLIGRALQKRDVREVNIPDAAGPAEGGGQAADTGDSTAGGGSAMDRLTTGSGSEDPPEDSAADDESAGGSLAEAGGAESAGSKGRALSVPSVPPELTDSSQGGSADGSGTGTESAKTGSEDGTVGGWAGPSGASAPAPAATPTSTPAAAPAATATAAPAAGSDFPYTVQTDDSAWKLAKRFYGNGKHYRRIVKANTKVDFDRLKVGTKLIIPGRAAGSVPTSSAAAPAATPAGVRVHTVVRGDSPYKLAKKYLGAGMRYQEILDLNPGIDPNRLKIGQKLNIPAR